jgi:hypothetical protein
MPDSDLPPDLQKRLKAEVAAPYKGLRRIFYLTFAASGGLGAFVFLVRVLVGRDLGTNCANLALQLGLLVLMIWLWRLEERPSG